MPLASSLLSQALKAAAPASAAATAAADGPYASGGGLRLYFALARGAPEAPALDMSKYFDTNYHFLKPELSAVTGECMKDARAGWLVGWRAAPAMMARACPTSSSRARQPR